MQSVLERSDPSRKTMVPAGTVLLTEGMTSGRLYVLVEGSIEVVRGETQVAVVSEPGSMFGEMSMLLELPHTATVRTLSPRRSRRSTTPRGSCGRIRRSP